MLPPPVLPCYPLVRRWRSGPAAQGYLVAHSCYTTAQGSPALSIRATTNIYNPAAGPWTCEG